MPERDRRLIQHPEEFRFVFDANNQLVNTVRKALSVEGNTWLDRRSRGLQLVSEYALTNLGVHSEPVHEMQEIAGDYQDADFPLGQTARIQVNATSKRVRLGIIAYLPKDNSLRLMNSRLKRLDSQIAPRGYMRLFVMLPPQSLTRIPVYSSERLLRNSISAKPDGSHAVSMSSQLYVRQRKVGTS